jgi:hypothetical protein
VQTSKKYSLTLHRLPATPDTPQTHWGKVMQSAHKIIAKTATLLKQGKIIAIKGNR